MSAQDPQTIDEYVAVLLAAVQRLERELADLQRRLAVIEAQR